MCSSVAKKRPQKRQQQQQGGFGVACVGGGIDAGGMEWMVAGPGVWVMMMGTGLRLCRVGGWVWYGVERDGDRGRL